MKGLAKKVGEQEERRTLVEALMVRISIRMSSRTGKFHVALMVDQRASTTSKVILFKNGDLEASLCQTCRCGNTANAGAYIRIGSVFAFADIELAVHTDNYGSLRH